MPVVHSAGPTDLGRAPLDRIQNLPRTVPHFVDLTHHRFKHFSPRSLIIFHRLVPVLLGYPLTAKAGLRLAFDLNRHYPNWTCSLCLTPAPNYDKVPSGSLKKDTRGLCGCHAARPALHYITQNFRFHFSPCLESTRVRLLLQGPVDFLVLGARRGLGTGQFCLSPESQNSIVTIFRPVPRTLPLPRLSRR